MDPAPLDWERSTHSTEPLFADELQGFIGACQVLSGAASAHERSLPEIAESLCAALPRPRCSADFLLLRSIVVEFATRAIDTTTGGIAGLRPLMRLRPNEQPLAEVFVRCMSDAGARAIAADVPTTTSGQALRASRALSTITARCAEPDLSAAAIASAIRVSERGLGKLLHAHAGAGFRALLRQARVKEARALLEQSLYSIKEIAVQVGYSWTSQFDRDFRRECGVTPGRYRLAHGLRSG